MTSGFTLHAKVEVRNGPPHIVTAITDKFALLTRFPFIDKSFESAKRPNIRSFPVSNYVIFYSTNPAEIRILRIIHASRDAWDVFTQE